MKIITHVRIRRVKESTRFILVFERKDNNFLFMLQFQVTCSIWSTVEVGSFWFLAIDRKKE